MMPLLSQKVSVSFNKFFNKPLETEEELPEVIGLLAGPLFKGKWVMFHSLLGRVKTWDKERATIILESCTSQLADRSYDTSVKGSTLFAGIDTFRSVNPDEVLTYLPEAEL